MPARRRRSQACTSPRAYSALSEGSHTFSVFATSGGTADSSPATATWAVDTTPPTVPTNLSAVPSRAPSVALSWTASTDEHGVAGYDIFRNTALLASVGAVTTLHRQHRRGRDDVHLRSSCPRRGRQPLGAIDRGRDHDTRAVRQPLDARAVPHRPGRAQRDRQLRDRPVRQRRERAVRRGRRAARARSPPPRRRAAVTISVDGIFEYQWKANLALPAAGTYCYRPYLGPVDLLGGNASPQFQSQVPFGLDRRRSPSPCSATGARSTPTAQNPDQANVMRQIANSGVRFAVTTGDNGYPSGSQGNYGDLQQTGADTSAIFGASFWGGVGAVAAALPGHRQPRARPRRRRPPAPRQLAPGCRGRDVGRSLPEGHVLLS